MCWRSSLLHHKKLDMDGRWTIVKCCVEDLHCFIPELWGGWLGDEPPCLILCVESVLCVFTEHLTWTSGKGPTPMRTQTRWRCPTSGASLTKRTTPSGSLSIQRTSLASSSSRLATWFQVRCHQRCGCCRICFQLVDTPQVLKESCATDVFRRGFCHCLLHHDPLIWPLCGILLTSGLCDDLSLIQW